MKKVIIAIVLTTIGIIGCFGSAHAVMLTDGQYLIREDFSVKGACDLKRTMDGGMITFVKLVCSINNPTPYELELKKFHMYIKTKEGKLIEDSVVDFKQPIEPFSTVRLKKVINITDIPLSYTWSTWQIYKIPKKVVARHKEEIVPSSGEGIYTRWYSSNCHDSFVINRDGSMEDEAPKLGMCSIFERNNNKGYRMYQLKCKRGKRKDKIYEVKFSHSMGNKGVPSAPVEMNVYKKGTDVNDFKRRKK